MRRKNTAIPLILLILVVVGGLIYTGVINIGGGESLAAGDSVDGDTIDLSRCAVEDSTVTIISADAFDSAVGSGNHRYRIDDGLYQTIADGSTFTASPGNSIEIIYNAANASGFETVEKATIPCAGTKTFFGKTYRNGTASIRVFNEENVLMSSAANETIAANDVVSLDGDVAQASERAYPNGGIVTLEYNTSVYDKVEISFDDIGKKSAPTPAWNTVSSTHHQMRTFEMPVVIDSSPRHGFTLTVDAGSTEPGRYNANIIMCMVPARHYYDNDDNQWKLGVEDEDGSQIVSPECQTLYVD